MQISEIALAVKQICDEKGLSLESVIETIEAALAAAYRKDFGNRMQNIKVHFDLDTGNFEVYDVKTVVSDEFVEESIKAREEEMAAQQEQEESQQDSQEKKGKKQEEQKQEEGEGEEEEKPRYNPKTMISFSEAREEFPDIQEGDEYRKPLEVPAAFGRMAAQTAKQVIIQKLREAERDTLYNKYKEKEGSIINGMVQRVEGRLVFFDLGDVSALLPPGEQVRGEQYRIGTRLKVYIQSVVKGSKGPEITVSRTSPEIVKRLFALEVPEIAAGTVEIVSVAREAGSRSKVAVVAHEDNVDPIGSCVGQRGTRVQTVIHELGGEKIDIIEFNEDVRKFIANALAPAKVSHVELYEDERKATAYVAEDQLSLAIGKAGQNVRLAAQLTGWKIDIVQEGTDEVKAASEEEAQGEAEAQAEEEGKENGVQGAGEDARKEEEQKEDAAPSDNENGGDSGVSESVNEEEREENAASDEKTEA